jgi:hypothetical protein
MHAPPLVRPGKGRGCAAITVAVTSSNIARILNVYPRKGRIAVGSDADIVVWDPAASKTITAKNQLSRIDYNVFEGFACLGAPAVTLSRGKIAWKNGELRADGHYLERPPFSPVHVANSTWKLWTAPQAVPRADVTLEREAAAAARSSGIPHRRNEFRRLFADSARAPRRSMEL